jgi:hypothetical protein
LAGLKETLRTKNYPRDADFRERFISSKLYGAGDRIGKTKLILERLEESFEHLEQASFDELQIPPVAVVIMGQRFPVSTWREVSQKTLETICDLDNERFDQIVTQFPKFIGRDPAKFRSSRKLLNGTHMGTNLSATAIHRYCIQATEVAGLSSDDWRVEYEVR